MEALFYNEIIDALPISPSDISNVSRMDSVISNNCIHHTLRGWPENLSDKVKPYVQRKMELSVHQGSLLLGTIVIVPEKTSDSSPTTTTRWESWDYEN